MRVVVIPDKFKGTLTAPDAAAAIQSGWSLERPSDTLELIPMSDGGDGFGATLALQEGGVRKRMKTVNAAGESIWAPWWWIPKSRTAVIETALVIGLAQLPPGKFHPFDLDTFGLGKLIGKVCAEKPKTILIGLGGSATNDGGMGMARALGWEFVDQAGEAIESWTQLDRLARVEPPPPMALPPSVVVAVDVRNRLLGREGASRIYGPQKGLRESDMPHAESCLAALARCVRKVVGRNDATRPGAGAAGGLGFACFAFLNGEAEPGFDVFARHAHLESKLQRADLVITGEGSIDRSSLMGKGVGRVAHWCRELGKPCLGMGGVIGSQKSLARSFEGLYSLVGDVTNEQEAMAAPRRCLKKLARHVAREWTRQCADSKR